MVQDHNPNSPENPYGLQIGEKVPDFAMEDITGRLFDLKEEYRKGPMLLNFFRGHF